MGVACQDLRTCGPWSGQERSNHINCLKLRAATLALQTFTKDRRGISVLLRIDNTTVAYINNRGGTASLNLTDLADTESQTLRDWMLDRAIFREINRLFSPIQVDLFASRLTHQCQVYYSWWPDPLAAATDAFLQDWSGIKGYANPPWNLIGRALAQVIPGSLHCPSGGPSHGTQYCSAC